MNVRRASPTAPPILLAVEDEAAIVELLRVIAEPLGVQVVEAPDAGSALAALDRMRPAIVTLDLVLPDQDGFAVLEHIRARRDLEDVPVIAITALTDQSAIKRAYALGAADFVSKPFNIDAVDAKLRCFLKLRALADEVRERERFLDDVVEQLASGLLVCDREGRMLRLNPAGARMLGVARASDVLGQRLGDVAPGAEAALQVADHGARRQAVVRASDGARILGYTTGALEGGGVVVVFRELTGSGAQEIAPRLEELGRAARSFAHEVRNPIAAISAAAQMIRRGDVDAALRGKLARAVEGEALRIGGLVREYVEHQAPPAPTGRLDLAQLLEEIVDVNLLGADGRERVRLDCATTLPTVVADASRIKQVVLNLLLNALAATQAGGAVTLRAATAEAGGVAITVADTGHGIAPDDLPRIFEEAFSTRGGLGLGLPIARRIVEHHGGRLEVESLQGRGTTFTVWLRAVEEAGEEHP